MHDTAEAEPIDLDDTSSCPNALDCELCDGSTAELVRVATASTQLGIICLTVCDDCAAGPLPTMTTGRILGRVGAHAGHLGVDVDALAGVPA